jgi:hypothetical protein
VFVILLKSDLVQKDIVVWRKQEGIVSYTGVLVSDKISERPSLQGNF